MHLGTSCRHAPLGDSVLVTRTSYDGPTGQGQVTRKEERPRGIKTGPQPAMEREEKPGSEARADSPQEEERDPISWPEVP